MQRHIVRMFLCIPIEHVVFNTTLIHCAFCILLHCMAWHCITSFLLYPGTLHYTTPYYIIMCFSVAVCYSRQFRTLLDNSTPQLYCIIVYTCYRVMICYTSVCYMVLSVIVFIYDTLHYILLYFAVVITFYIFVTNILHKLLKEYIPLYYNKCNTVCYGMGCYAMMRLHPHCMCKGIGTHIYNYIYTRVYVCMYGCM